MKRIFALFVCALGLVGISCERHPASELEGDHGASPSHPAAAAHEAAAPHRDPHAAPPAEGAPPAATPRFIP